MSGVFVTFEGGEGVGKSTQLHRLAARLEALGVEVVLLREPGGTVLGDRIRELLLDPASVGMDAHAELLLYEASRAQLVAEVIRPALDRGAVVLCDRFTDSTLAYQGGGRGLPTAQIAALNEAATAGLHPDVTVLLDLPLDEGLRRATTNGADRLEAEDVAFHERVAAAFLGIAMAEPDRVVVLDASGTADEVEARVVHALAGRLRAVGVPLP